jgi:excisionase family DNA binding protein
MNSSFLPETHSVQHQRTEIATVSATGNQMPTGQSGATPSRLVPLVYTVEETAAVLNCSTKSVRRLIARGYLCPCKAVRKILIPRKQVEDFLKATCDVPKAFR